MWQYPPLPMSVVSVSRVHMHQYLLNLTKVSKWLGTIKMVDRRTFHEILLLGKHWLIKSRTDWIILNWTLKKFVFSETLSSRLYQGASFIIVIYLNLYIYKLNVCIIIRIPFSGLLSFMPNICLTSKWCHKNYPPGTWSDILKSSSNLHNLFSLQKM